MGTTEFMGGTEPGKLDPVLSAAMVRALMILRDYLDQIGFIQLYKFIATPRCYQSNPNVLSWGNQDGAAALGPHLDGDGVLPGLATALMLKVPVPQSALTPFEQRVAEYLVDAGLLARSGDHLQMGAYQLISAHDMPLLIDSRINYPCGGLPDVYFGSDSLLLTFYVDTGGIAPVDPAIDLGSGSGVIGLYLGRFSYDVTMTDVSPHALQLAHINRLLNRMTGRVAIREERCEDTIGKYERYRIVTFNPPFVPLPEGLDAPVYARGAGADGLGYCRMLLEDLDQILLPDGTAYVVANLLGTADGPFFVEELRRRSGSRSRAIDVYIDSTCQLSAGAPMFEALGRFLHEANPAIAREECQRRMEALQIQTLGATHAYLSVLVIRGIRNLRPSVRVYRRKATTPSHSSRPAPSA